MERTLGLHWSATTHGTWLHGDPRGSWKDGKLIGPDPFLRAEIELRMSGSAVRFSKSEVEIVANAFGSIVKERRHLVFAATVQSMHVHFVFGPLDEDVKNVIARLKRRASMEVLNHRRKLLNSPAILAGQLPGQNGRAISVPRTIWTAGQFPVFIFSESHLVNAIEYVRDHNRRIGLPADPYDWITPLLPAQDKAGTRAGRIDDNERLRL